MDERKVAVISTGNGGQTMAAYFASRGYRVALYAREPERIEMFRSNVFHLSGKVNVRVEVDLISSDMAEVIRDAHLIMVTTPSQYHKAVAVSMAPCVRTGQIVVLNPGRTFGTFYFEKCLRDYGCTAHPILAEAESFVFACRCHQIGYPVIHSIKSNMPVAAHHEEDLPQVLQALHPAFPQIVGTQSVLETSFNNIGMIFHPLPTLMNLTRVEARTPYRHYIDGISPLVADMLERLDGERVAVAAALGVDVLSAYAWLKERYNATGDTLYQRIQNNEAYQEILAPADIYTRYVFEDIPTGCVPVYCVAQRLGILTPMIRDLIAWGSAIYEVDFLAQGRNETTVDFDAVLARAAGWGARA